MLEYTVRPLDDRTWFTRRHTASLFTARWSQTLDLLERELKYLAARDIVFRVDVRPDQIRNDGGIYANANAATPAVVVEFESKHGPLFYRCDRYDTKPWGNKGGMQLWQHNIRAVALTLEALRAAERHGAIEAGQQYTGFKALNAGRAVPASHMTSDEAWSIIGSYGHEPVARLRARGANDGFVRAAYRAAKVANHPDKRGGDRALWDQVETAAAVLGVR